MVEISLVNRLGFRLRTGCVSTLFFFSFLVVAQPSSTPPYIFAVQSEEGNCNFPYYSSHVLTAVNPNINRIVFVVHGNGRNGQGYFQNMQAAANLSGASSTTAIVAPQFLLSSDAENLNAENYLTWSNDGWKEGGESVTNDLQPVNHRVSSYAVIDQLLTRILESEVFPNLTSLIIAGHSAGGQLVNRYAAGNQIHETLASDFDIRIRYIVANPSSYLYFNDERAVSGFTDLFIKPSTTCLSYDQYKYGLTFRNRYMQQASDETIINQYARREVVYLLGADDNDTNADDLDKSCEAMLQGTNRLERGQIYFNYLQHFFGDAITENHFFQVVPGVAHSNSGMFQSAAGREWLFDNLPVTSVEDQYRGLISVYPNPSRGLIRVRLPRDVGKGLQLTLFDVLGAKAVTSNFVKDSTSGEYVAELKPGIYYLQISSSTVRFTEKIVVTE